jgi:hypothetical protein
MHRLRRTQRRRNDDRNRIYLYIMRIGNGSYEGRRRAVSLFRTSAEAIVGSFSCIIERFGKVNNLPAFFYAHVDRSKGVFLQTCIGGKQLV